MKKIKLILIVVMAHLFVINGINADNPKRKKRRKEGVRPVTNALYSEECGQCHFAYPPGLLPERSWKKLISALNLKDHFGEELDFTNTKKNQLLRYLVDNSADKSSHKRSYKIDREISKSETPIRITETKYIKSKHRKIPSRLITGNKDVESLSNCTSCHKEAEKGIFDDDTVLIPGYGRWDDD
jgi:hypothetical protein